ncbi:MAG: RNA-binding transcriptional accessory protein, partial [Kiritimatiellae bacterium]|nr:RNA-binding transcriptional accessory protein [Kiritimatiellia bacterium]
MNQQHCGRVAAGLSLRPAQVAAVASLLEGGATVPFIARYRKEATGELDEVAIAAVRDSLARLAELDDRRETVLSSLRERGLLTPDLEAKLLAAESLPELEDLYLPYRPKRRTRAQVARERGLSPLAAQIMAQEPGFDPFAAAAAYVKPGEEGLDDPETVLAGARDIVAEAVNEDSGAREEMRELFEEEGAAVSKVVEGKEEAGAKFADYFDASEPLSRIPSHRMLALLRGEKEGFLSLTLRPPREDALEALRGRFVAEDGGDAADQVRQACDSAYARLLGPAMEVEARARAFDRASDEAIAVFASNLRELLMAAPLGRKAVLALDPGIRTGCKVVALDP